MARRTLAGGLVLIFGCAFANPLARTRDGTTSASRVRVGIAAASFRGDCEYDDRCTVQLSMAHTEPTWRRVKIVAVRLQVDGIDLGPVPTDSIKVWSRGAYRSSRLDMKPFGTSKINISLAPIVWSERFAELGLLEFELPISVEVDFEIDDEPLVVRSMFDVQGEKDRVFVMT